ncbi:hypothetical protein DZD52_12385 [Xanthomonas nasturtii]|uniref:Uncharacterized protein n=1 Tax=Xanthomonas nasturtii TaxID=1843581 RepID=A0A3E1KIY7_9XANT|nr:hypothetical protein DZD52_12385 [Xanthomonas nasturtii]
MPMARSALLGLRSSAIAIAIRTDIETDAANHKHGALLPQLRPLPVPGCWRITTATIATRVRRLACRCQPRSAALDAALHVANAAA